MYIYIYIYIYIYVNTYVFIYIYINTHTLEPSSGIFTYVLVYNYLELCLRCVPHDEDTGGFFVATLRKVGKPVPASSASASVSADVTGEEKVTKYIYV
jgi:hypothetical protein